MHRGLGWLLACASIGCGPSLVPGDGEGSGTSGSDGDPAPTGSATASTVTATTGLPPSTTDLPPSTTTADDGTDDDVLDDGPWGFDCGAAPPGTQHHCIGKPTCEPPTPDVHAWISVDGGAMPMDPVPEPHVYACTIADWMEEGGVTTFELACADGPHTLALGTSGILFDTTGDFVLSVIHSAATFEGGDQLVTLRRAGGELVLAGASTPWRPDDDGVPADFFDPLDIMLIEGLCPVEPPPGGGEPCYGVERQALRFATERQIAEVYDHGVEYFSPYLLLVEQAEQRHDITCTDTASTWYSWLAIPPIPR